jgi:hypothetical protein
LKRHAPATLRNRVPILEGLKAWLPANGKVLEISSGSGEHAVFFAPQLPQLQWQPSDRGDAEIASINAHRDDAQATNLLSAIRLDVSEIPWPILKADVVFCANMIHIAPWACTLSLFQGAATVLPVGGLLVLYGPFRLNGQHTAASNEAFEQWLLSQNSEWGVRDLGAVDAIAASHGFVMAENLEMPANNRMICWRFTGMQGPHNS